MLQRNERVTVRISGPTSFRSMAGKIVFEKVTRRVISGSCPRPWSRRLGGKARPGAEPASKQNPESGSLGRAALWAAERLSPSAAGWFTARPGPAPPSPARTRARRREAAASATWGLCTWPFQPGTKPFAVAAAAGGLAKTPFTFYTPPFPVHSLLILGSVGDPLGRPWRALGLWRQTDLLWALSGRPPPRLGRPPWSPW